MISCRPAPLIKRLTHWKWTAFFVAVIALYAGIMLHRGIVRTFRPNDFEFFYAISVAAAEHDPGIYGVVSPVLKLRPFLYPPAAAVLLVPLSWLSYEASGICFVVVKIVCLLVILWGVVRYSGAAPPDTLGIVGMMAAVAIITFRPVHSDFSNGAINILVAALAACGVWTMMQARRWGWIGGLPLAAAIALKLTPVLLCAMPFLNRKWRALAACIGFSGLLLVALPAAWFGPSNFRAMASTHAEIMGGYMTQARDVMEQCTFNEVIQFTVAQAKADPDGYVSINRDTFIVLEDGSLVPGRVPEGMSQAAATAIWWTIGVAVGVSFLLARLRLFRGRGWDWTWDLAMLCVLMTLLVPHVRKHHLVVLMVPVAWIIARLDRLVKREGGIVAAWQRHRVLWILVVASVILMLLGADLEIPMSDVFPQPLRPGYFLAMLLIAAQLLALPGADEAAAVRTRGASAPTGGLSGA